MEIYNQDNRILAHDRFLSHARENESVRCELSIGDFELSSEKDQVWTDKTIPRLTNLILSD